MGQPWPAAGRALKMEHKEHNMNISKLTQKSFLDPFDRLPNHPLKPAMRSAMIAARAAAEQFGGHRIALASDRRMTELGQRQALRDALTGDHGKAWSRAKAPVAKARAEIKARRAALVVKDHDYAGVDSLAGLAKVLVAESREKETREYLLGLNPQARMAKALTGDPRIVESAMKLAPELSGSDELPHGIADQIEERYFQQKFPKELAELEADEAVVRAAEDAVGSAYNEMRQVLGLSDHERDRNEFETLMKSIEVGPWLTSDKKQVIEIGADGFAKYRPASADEVETGRVYNEAEFRASLTA
jgi:hypothetical protein